MKVLPTWVKLYLYMAHSGEENNKVEQCNQDNSIKLTTARNKYTSIMPHSLQYFLYISNCNANNNELKSTEKEEEESDTEPRENWDHGET